MWIHGVDINCFYYMKLKYVLNTFFYAHIFNITIKSNNIQIKYQANCKTNKI